MALMELLYNCCELHCPYEENGCKFVYTGKDKTLFWRHRETCIFDRRSNEQFKCGIMHPIVGNEEKPNAKEIDKEKPTNKKCQTTPKESRKCHLQPNWIDSLRHAQICETIDKLAADDKQSEAEHKESSSNRRRRCTSTTNTVPETDVFCCEKSNPYVHIYPKAKVTKEARALFRFQNN